MFAKKEGIKNFKIFCVLINCMQKQLSCKKEARPSKVESSLKDECMVWLTTRSDIWMRPRLKY